MVPIQSLTLLAKYEPSAVELLERKRLEFAPGLPSLSSVLEKGDALGGSDAVSNVEEWTIWVTVTRDALARATTQGLGSFGVLRGKIDAVDRLRLAADVFAALSGLLAASAILPVPGSQISAGVACVSAVLAAVIPRLARSDAGGDKPWAVHYTELVDALVKGDAVHRRLTTWLDAKGKGGNPSDPSADVAEAERLCGALLRERLLVDGAAG